MSDPAEQPTNAPEGSRTSISPQTPTQRDKKRASKQAEADPLQIPRGLASPSQSLQLHVPGQEASAHSPELRRQAGRTCHRLSRVARRATLPRRNAPALRV